MSMMTSMSCSCISEKCYNVQMVLSDLCRVVSQDVTSSFFQCRYFAGIRFTWRSVLSVGITRCSSTLIDMSMMTSMSCSCISEKCYNVQMVNSDLCRVVSQDLTSSFFQCRYFAGIRFTWRSVFSVGITRCVDKFFSYMV
jgi:hypothetical protein